MLILKRPQKGDKVLQSLYDSVNSILDYLPTITVRGDSYSTYVEHSKAGTIIHAKHSVFPDQAGGGRQYFAGSGLYLKGNTFYNALSGDYDVYGSGGITIVDNVISCLYKPSGVASGNYTSGTYISLGEEDQGQTPINCTLTSAGILGSNLHSVEKGQLDVPPNYYIFMPEEPISGHYPISSDLQYLTQLYNYDLVYDAQASEGSGYMEHFTDLGDFFTNSNTGNRGLGTEIGFHRTTIGIHTDHGLVYPIDGLKVNCTISGGRYMGTSAVPRIAYGEELEPEELTVNCLLSGDWDVCDAIPSYKSGFIKIVDHLDQYGIPDGGGIISTTLHGDETTIHIEPTDGTISCMLPSGLFDIFNNIPTDGNYVLGCLSGTLTWLSTCQCDCCQTFYPEPTPEPDPVQEPEEEQNNG